MMRVLLLSFILLLSQPAYAQFDFLGTAQRIFNTSRPILTQEQTTAPKTQTSASVKSSSISSSVTQLLSQSDIENGLRQALQISATKVTNQLGQTNGFYGDPKVKIPLPGQLQTAHSLLSQVGLESLGNDLQLKMNRAAEMAMPKAKELFISSIQKMTLKDAQNILTGPDNAATQFFRQSMSPDLFTALQPIIQNQLKNVKGMQTYEQLVQQYANIPFAPKINTNLSSYVANMAMDGMFSYMAREEAAIRANPVERSTSLLKKVFSAIK